jgi:hypothetical protein
MLVRMTIRARLLFTPFMRPKATVEAGESVPKRKAASQVSFELHYPA